MLIIFSRYNLRSVTLNRVAIREETLRRLRGPFLNLEKLNLAHCVQLRDREFKLILENFGLNLKELDLSYTQISGFHVRGIKGEKMLPSLEKLTLRSCYDLLDGGLDQVLRTSGIKLRELNLFHTNIYGIGFLESLKSFPRLEALNLGKCFNLNLYALYAILNICGKTLRELNLSRSCLSGIGFVSHVKSLPMLEILRLNECYNLNDEGLQEILSTTDASVLKSLYVSKA